MEKYSRGRRGAPAKGVGRATGARVQIPLSPFSMPMASKKKCLKFKHFFFALKRLSDVVMLYENVIL